MINDETRSTGPDYFSRIHADPHDHQGRTRPWRFLADVGYQLLVLLNLHLAADHLAGLLTGRGEHAVAGLAILGGVPQGEHTEDTPSAIGAGDQTPIALLVSHRGEHLLLQEADPGMMSVAPVKLTTRVT